MYTSPAFLWAYKGHTHSPTTDRTDMVGPFRSSVQLCFTSRPSVYHRPPALKLRQSMFVTALPAFACCVAWTDARTAGGRTKRHNCGDSHEISSMHRDCKRFIRCNLRIVSGLSLFTDRSMVRTNSTNKQRNRRMDGMPTNGHPSTDAGRPGRAGPA